VKRLLLFAPILVFAAACTGTPTEPAAVDDCNGLAKLGAVLVEDYLVVVEGMPLAVIRGEEPAPPEVAALNARGAEFDARAAALECDPVALNAAIVERIEDLSSDDLTGSLFLDVVRSGAFPVTTGVTVP
jgi:hypothetical protein